MNEIGDVRAFALRTASQLRAHEKSLAGKSEEANQAQLALQDTATAINKHANEHADWAYTATERWTGKSADGFDRRAGRVGKSLDLTADAATEGATIVATTHAELRVRHDAVQQLLDEYVGKATRMLDAASKVALAGSQTAIHSALGEVLAMRDDYTRESAKHLAAAQTQLKDAAGQLRGLERSVEHDGFADPGRKRKRDGAASSVTRPSRSVERGRKPEPGQRRTQPARPRPQPAQPTPAPTQPRSGDRQGRPDQTRPRPAPQQQRTNFQDGYPGHRPPPANQPGPPAPQHERTNSQDGYPGHRPPPADHHGPPAPQTRRPDF